MPCVHFWPRLLAWLLLVFSPWPGLGGAQIGHGVCCWLHPFPMHWATGCLGVFSWCVLGVLSFAGGSVPYLGSSWCLGLLRDILCCCFTGCRCSAPAPGAAALAGLLSYAAVLVCLLLPGSGVPCVHFWPRLFVESCWFSRRGLVVLTFSWVWCAIGHGVPFPMCWVSGSVSFILDFGRAFVRWWLCPVWVPVGFSNSCGTYSAAPLLAAAAWRLPPALRLLPAC